MDEGSRKLRRIGSIKEKFTKLYSFEINYALTDHDVWRLTII